MSFCREINPSVSASYFRINSLTRRLAGRINSVLFESSLFSPLSVCFAFCLALLYYPVSMVTGDETLCVQSSDTAACVVCVWYRSGSAHTGVSVPVGPAGKQTERFENRAGEAQPVISAPVLPVPCSKPVLPDQQRYHWWWVWVLFLFRATSVKRKKHFLHPQNHNFLKMFLWQFLVHTVSVFRHFYGQTSKLTHQWITGWF